MICYKQKDTSITLKDIYLQVSYTIYIIMHVCNQIHLNKYYPKNNILSLPKIQVKTDNHHLVKYGNRINVLTSYKDYQKGTLTL